jgi:hypothetical protein
MPFRFQWMPTLLTLNPTLGEYIHEKLSRTKMLLVF